MNVGCAEDEVVDSGNRNGWKEGRTGVMISQTSTHWYFMISLYLHGVFCVDLVFFFPFQADPQQLKSVVNLLRMVSRGDGSRCASLSNMRPPSCKGMRNLQSVMVITSRKDYPVTTHFPPGLRSVTVCELWMCCRVAVNVF